MPSMLRAVCKALSTVAGPLGFPGEFALSLYDDAKAEQREEALKAMLTDAQSVSDQVLQELFEVKHGLTGLREQLLAGLNAAAAMAKENSIAVRSTENLETRLTALLRENDTQLQVSGFVTQGQLTSELSRLYAADIDLFLVAIGNADFPLDSIPHGEAARVVIFRFLERCPALNLQTQQRIFEALSRDNPGSNVLRAVATILSERISSKSLGGP